MNIKNFLNLIEVQQKRSAWGKGVKIYAYELMEDITQEEFDELVNLNLLEKRLLNGADNWHHYSYGGCSLIYNEDIAERLCSPSELKKCKGGLNRPNKNEEWLDVQARALYQAHSLIKRLFKATLLNNETHA